MDNELENIKSDLIWILNDYKDKVREAYIFGSFSDGSYHRTSDLDIALNCDDDVEFEKIAEALEDNMRTIRRLDIHNIRDGGSFVFDIEEVRNGIKIL